MAKIVFEQARALFWNVPRPPEGKGSFFIGQVTSLPTTKKREKADKTGFYDTVEFNATTKIQLQDGAEMASISFIFQDLVIGGAIRQAFPVVPGKVADGPIGKYFAVFYDDTNAKGYFNAAIYASTSLQEVIDDMNGAHLARMIEILGGGDALADWKFSLTAYTPKLSEYLKEKGVTDDIPF